jgi:hypothetical protein
MAAAQLLLASPSTIAEVVARLPAESRAQVAWAPKRVADMAAALLTEPYLTDALIERSADAYFESVRALSPAVLGLVAHGVDLKAAIQLNVENDLKQLVERLPSIAATNAKAAARAMLTVVVVGQLGADAIRAIDLHTLQKAMAALGPKMPQEHLSLFRTGALVIAVLEGLKRGSPIPGRVDALARRADAAAREFATVLSSYAGGLRLPWYDESAPDSASASAFASWNPDNLPSVRKATSPVSQEDLEAWERVKEAIDSARPHRKLFS